jgi:diguanylate cyclase (GGDEF)-like protein/PAS domain S-box-containing protein
MWTFQRQSILIRAAMQVVGIGLIVGFGFVFVTTYLTERYYQHGVSRRIQELMITVERTVQIACFTKDQGLALEVVNGLATNSEVFGSTIIGDSEILAEHKKEAVDERYRKAVEGRISKKIVSPFDAAQIVGELIIDPDPEIVSMHVKESSAFVALLLGLQLLAVISAVVVVVLLWIVRPIKRMSDRLHVMDAHSIERLAVPGGLENTEIGRLATDISLLGERLRTSLDEEHHLLIQREIGERKYHAIFENADTGIFVIDQHLALESCNQALFRQLGLPSRTAPDEKLDLLSLRWRETGALARLVGQCVEQNRPVSDDFEYVLSNAEVRWFSVTLTPVSDELIQGQLSDISRHKQKELLAQQEAVTDTITGLLNRTGFLQKVDEEISAYVDDERSGFALLIVNFDGFRRVNESLGLASGDHILSITGQRLRSCVKGSDFISRLGNDSFGIMVRSVSDERATANVATRISVALKEFFEVGGNTPLKLGVSIGITLFPYDGNDQETLLRNAEMALEHARLGGGGRYCFFESFMAREAVHRRRLENALFFAARHKELIVRFQPIVDLPARRMAGVEALIRWEHPLLGLIPPDVFIPLAEETGSIVGIGLWLLEVVVQQLAEWKKQGIDRYISINISARQIPDGLPPITLIETLSRYGVDPANLAIEITESVFMGDSNAVKVWLDTVHESGFRIYLDDFGTGYSSLSYIKRFPMDVLKVDKSFVRDMSENNSDRTLVEAIINMARSLKLDVVAEGVETQSQIDLLKEAGCRYIQGYYFSRPVAAEAIEDARRRIEQLF